MPDPLYSNRATQVFALTPGAGPLKGPPNASNGQPQPYCSGFMVDIDGTVTVVGKEGPTASVVLTVKAGVKYDIAIRQLLAVGGGVTTVTGFL